MNFPDRLLRPTTIIVTSMPNVPAPTADVTTQSFESAIGGATRTITPLNLAYCLDVYLDPVKAEDTAEGE